MSKRFFGFDEFGAWVRSQIQTLTDYLNQELSEVNTRMDGVDQTLQSKADQSALDSTNQAVATKANQNEVSDALDTKLDATANAVSASKLQTARTITIGNTSKSFDGSANVSWSLDEIGVTDAFKDSIITGNAIINVGSVDGVAVIYSGISTEHVIVLKVEVNAGTNDRYDIEIYDGAISSGGTLVYRAQQVQGNYLDSFAFYHQCQNTDLHARVVNLRQDGASFSANVKITLRLE